MVHQTADWMRTVIRDGVRGIFQCGEQDQLEQYIMAKVWLDPAMDVDATLDEFFRLYFGPAAAPMKQHYTRLEEIATDPGNYPEGPRRPQGLDWKRLAWKNLGKAERLKELDALMIQAQASGRGPRKSAGGVVAHYVPGMDAGGRLSSTIAANGPAVRTMPAGRRALRRWWAGQTIYFGFA